MRPHGSGPGLETGARSRVPSELGSLVAVQVLLQAALGDSHQPAHLDGPDPPRADQPVDGLRSRAKVLGHLIDVEDLLHPIEGVGSVVGSGSRGVVHDVSKVAQLIL